MFEIRTARLRLERTFLRLPANPLTAETGPFRNYPAPRQAPKPRPRRFHPWMRIPATLAVMCTAAAIAVLAGGERMSQASAAAALNLDVLARMTGFGIDQVVLTGHRHTADSDVFDALDLARARSLASFDTDGVRRRLERLPWVASAGITRVYPDRLDVRISERRPYAVWRRGSDEFLIDAGGRVLTAINRADGLGLPRVAGEGAATEAKALLDLLARYPSIAEKLDEAVRAGDRRWTLKLSGGAVVHLPAGTETAALEDITYNGRLAKLVARGNAIIDLRATSRIAVRPSGAGTLAAADRRPGY